MAQQKPRKRSEIPTADTWALEDLFPTDEAWEQELSTLNQDQQILASFEGRLGESGEIYMNSGAITPEEQELGFDSFIQSDDDDWEAVEFPDEDSVTNIAAAWGVDPWFSKGQYDCGVG